MKTDTQHFEPDWCSPPGATIADILSRRGLPIREFATMIRSSADETEALLQGLRPITREIAQKLEHVLGAPARFWLTREAQYRDDVARTERLGLAASWFGDLPVAEIARLGWIPQSTSRAERVSACLEFFGVPDVATWKSVYGRMLEEAAYKTSQTFESRPGPLAAWLRQGELLGERIQCSTWKPKELENALSGIRSLSRTADPGRFLPELRNRCAACGVALVVLRAPSGCRASGATRFLSTGKALLLLSFRYLSDDHFWFAFFHEVGHLLLHGREDLFLEGFDVSTSDEAAADAFAASILIPPAFEPALSTVPLAARDLIRLAHTVGVSPGIIVGQLQHRGRLRFGQMERLKRRFVWT